MATQRRNTLPSRLTEGRTYQINLPLERISFGKTKLVGQQMVQSYIVQDGVPVPQGNPFPAARQPVLVGQIVRVGPCRRHRLTDSISELNAHEGSMTYNGHRGATWSVVTAVSNDGKYFRHTPLFQSNNSHVNLVWNTSAGAFELTKPRVRDPNGPYYQTIQREWVDGADVLAFMGDRTYGSEVLMQREQLAYQNLNRVSHISQRAQPTQVPPLVIDAIRLRIKSRHLAAFWQRLNKATYDAHPVREHTRNWYSKSTRANRRRTGDGVSVRLKSALGYWSTGGTESAMNYLRSAVSLMEDFIHRSNNSRVDDGYSDSEVTETSTRVLEAVSRWTAKHNIDVRYAPYCGHFHTGESVRLLADTYGTFHDYCPTCAEGAQEVEYQGEMRLTHRQCLSYVWSDGVRRFTREPGIIGHRHSGKSIIGYVQPDDGANRDSFLTLGLELEMQAYNGNDKHTMAREMKAKMSNVLSAAALRKYLHFEEDGSTGQGGFEMVTGYTSLAMHDKLLKTLLLGENGRAAWAGRLRSHDASGAACGIHVHIQKPKHLLHATKMRYFINSAQNEQLIRDVARRYNESYARIDRNAGQIAPTKASVDLIKSVKYPSAARPTTSSHERMALDRINNDRYQALNFQNAHTVEFRIFRGSMLYESVMACLEFTQAVWQFCKDTSAINLTTEAFVDWINDAPQAASTRNLRKYLSKKGWSQVRVAKPVKTAPEPVVETESV